MTSSTRSTGKSTGPTEATIPAKPMTAAEAIAAARKSATHDVTSDNANVDELGYARVFDKNSLVGRPFTIIDWEDNIEEFGWVATVHIVSGAKALYFKDGSEVGVYAQLKALKEKGISTMIRCPKGLRSSQYDNQYDGRPTTTFYIDDNAA